MIHKGRLSGRTASTSPPKTKPRGTSFRPRIEPLEVREMLSGQDLLVTTYDDTAGLSVLRYNGATLQPTAGGVATGDNFLYSPQGVAVGPDGTFYVSNPATSTVSHYSAAGSFLGALGAGTLALPGTLKIGPADGLLYVGDINAGTIYKFDMSDDSLAGSIVLGYAPAGFNFVPDGTNDLVVGGFDTQGVIRYRSGGPDTLVSPGSGINPLGILAEADGDVLIADSDLGFDPLNHHQIMKYSELSDTTSQFINLTFPVGTGGSAGYPPQPTALMYDHDGNLLVGLSPDHNGNGAVQKYNIASGAYISTLVSSIGAPTGLAFIDPITTEVVSTYLFYDNSYFDGNVPGVSASDDAAIATDKTAYLPASGTSTFASVSSYTRGINGIMIDLYGPHGTLTANDFTFRVGNNNSPALWASAPAPSSLTVRGGAGLGGSDRIEIIWPDNAIQKEWLEVMVQGNTASSNTNTGLENDYLFYFGNALGDSGAGDSTDYRVSSVDEQAARNDPHGPGNRATISDTQDYNRDSLVNGTDQQAARNNATNPANALIFLNFGGPSAPQTADTSGVASALAADKGSASTTTASGPALPVAAAEPSTAAAPPRATIDWADDADELASAADVELADELLAALSAANRIA